MIDIGRENWTALRRYMSEIEQSDEPLQLIEDRGMWRRGDVSRISGIGSSTLRRIAEGKRPTNSQLAALKYAALHRALNL